MPTIIELTTLKRPHPKFPTTDSQFYCPIRPKSTARLHTAVSIYLSAAIPMEVRSVCLALSPSLLIRFCHGIWAREHGNIATWWVIPRSVSEHLSFPSELIVFRKLRSITSNALTRPKAVSEAALQDTNWCPAGQVAKHRESRYPATKISSDSLR